MRDLQSPTDCRHLVERFYDAVRTDDLLGPIFATQVDDWPEHLDTMARFWTSILFGVPLYHGNPVAMHRGLPIDEAHFARWLALWRATIAGLFEGPRAADVVARAERIAIVLRARLAEAG